MKKADDKIVFLGTYQKMFVQQYFEKVAPLKGAQSMPPAMRGAFLLPTGLEKGNK
jgi:hypothetical protein